jgi:hypothetical protein
MLMAQLPAALWGEQAKSLIAVCNVQQALATLAQTMMKRKNWIESFICNL